ncbi:transporter substrate-binding domain-containing protein [Bradyrhizobium arachidis]|uniref:transporter substrate-binding domain-containing protein n=1 Tax=Bradyrhizobium arachidis TaxID=858423 RepID=UPI002162A622|nr:transporter substrate-binding domain-containing protein [Bradyrhizobium arachidis]UVO35790.1 transporter substrate-binding domain-containing protein [Bradyrhizobium arachidis]
MISTPKLSFLVLLLSVICHSFPTFADEDVHLDSIRKAGKIKVAIGSAPPYSMVSPTGEATGASIDLLNRALKGMGLPALSPVLLAWDALIPGLQAQQFDFVGAAVNITAEQCKVVLYSTPYYAGQAGLFVLPGNPKHLTTVAEVARRPDIKIATLPSLTTYQGNALKQGVKPEQIIVVPDVQAGAAAVIGGRVDAFVVGQFTIPDPQQKGLEVVVDEQSPVYASGTVFRKEDKAFRDEFNKQLNSLIKGGAIQELYQKYGIANAEAQAKLLTKLNKASDVVPSCE